ncbi:MAG: hypothetical protein K5755_06390 [Clostridiales bacterium]|nr:hypothetical protein [Clostridiales bacterium]
MKRFFTLFLIVILSAFLFSSCLNRNHGGPTISVTVPSSVPDTTQGAENTSEQVTQDNGESVVQTTALPDNVSTEPFTTSQNQSDNKMVFTSDPDNPFINAVVSRYGVNASNLVAYYVSSGTSGANLVYEFDGTVGSDGRPVRTLDTLKNIYTVSAPPELLAKKASGTAAEGNEYNEKDTKLCRFFTEQVVFRFFAKDIQNA